MPKLFCVSDIHGFYDELQAALDAAGFDKQNPDHWLISCGDNLDRGSQPRQVISFLNSLERKVLIRGNHEDLLEKCIEREYPLTHDEHNGTRDTVYDLAGVQHSLRNFMAAAIQITPEVFRFTSQMVNYFETQHYVFVHGWVPLRVSDQYPAWYQREREYERDATWRDAHASGWEAASWRNGIECALNGLTIEKTVVCGHWHCSYGHHIVDGTPEFGDGANFNPFYADGIIAIDACTAASHKVNVVVLEDEFLNPD